MGRVFFISNNPGSAIDAALHLWGDVPGSGAGVPLETPRCGAQGVEERSREAGESGGAGGGPAAGSNQPLESNAAAQEGEWRRDRTEDDHPDQPHH